MASGFWSTWGTTLISILIGAAVTWAVAWYYFKQAGDELREESMQLRKLVSMILTAMEQQGAAKLNRDASGNIIGFVFEHVPTGGLSFSGHADTKFIPGTSEQKGIGDV